MIGKNNTYRIMKQFFDKPMKEFQIRELSRITDLSIPAVIDHLKILVEEKLVKKIEGNIYAAYKADYDSEKYKHYKKMDMLKRIYDSGLKDYLDEELSFPGAMVLFGSANYGEDIEKSDIDIFLIAKEKELELEKYESIINRKISLHFASQEKWASMKEKSKELANNILNGTTISGFLEAL